MVSFCDFFKLNELAQINVQGVFNHSWRGDFHRLVKNGKTRCEPIIGSGLEVGTPALNDSISLPVEIARLVNQKYFIYCVISDVFPILYVGISDGDMRSGVFGEGRLRHHIRKLLASIGGSTNHTEGWRNHAGVRHEAYKSKLASGEKVEWVDDIYISLAQVDSPKQIEGTVLDLFKDKFHQQNIKVEVLNTAEVKREPAQIQVPENLAKIFLRLGDCCKPHKKVNIGRKLGGSYYENQTSFASDSDGQLFKLLLDWARSHSDVEMVEGVVGQYTNQPQGYNSKPVVRFAELGKTGSAMPNRWFCRIPLKTSLAHGMTVILPNRLIRPALPQDLIETGKDANFRPLDIKDFLAHPNLYIF